VHLVEVPLLPIQGGPLSEEADHKGVAQGELPVGVGVAKDVCLGLQGGAHMCQEAGDVCLGVLGRRHPLGYARGRTHVPGVQAQAHGHSKLICTPQL